MKKYIFWLGICIIIPIIIQMILADNMSFKWVACRRYLIIASLISYILSKVELSKKIMVNFFLCILLWVHQWLLCISILSIVK